MNADYRIVVDSLYQENLIRVNQLRSMERDFQAAHKDWWCELKRADSLQVRLDTTYAKYIRERDITDELLEKLKTQVYWSDVFTIYRYVSVPGSYAVTVRVTGQHNGHTGISQLTLSELLLKLRKKPDERILD